LRLAKDAVIGAIVRTILAAIVRRMTVIQAQTKRKRKDRSACRAEKHRRRAGMLRVYGPNRPTSGVCATTDTARGRKTLDQLAQSGDLDVRRQATWGMSVNSSI